jgi:hypothetical protein
MLLNAQNVCPVCGFSMEEPPRDYNICPSCGTEFGVHDVNATLADLRASWIATGPKWWSKAEPQPENWNPFAQLARIETVTPLLGVPVQLGSATGIISGSSYGVPISTETSSWVTGFAAWAAQPRPERAEDKQLLMGF